MKVTGIFETSLYVADLARSCQFYRQLFEFPILLEDHRLVALQVVPGQVLLLFLRGGSTKPSAIPGGVIPAHDGSGNLHVAFSIPAESLCEWEDKLARLGVAIESRVTWPLGGVSLYFRDPDGHAVELAMPTIWKFV